MYSLTMGGVLVMVLGTFGVQYFGLTDACSTELATKAVEFGPLVTGAVMAWIGRARVGDVNVLGFRRR